MSLSVLPASIASPVAAPGLVGQITQADVAVKDLGKCLLPSPVAAHLGETAMTYAGAAEKVLVDDRQARLAPGGEPAALPAFELAGPRNRIFFDPRTVAISVSNVDCKNTLIESGFSGTGNTIPTNTLTTAAAAFFSNAAGYNFHLVRTGGDASYGEGNDVIVTDHPGALFIFDAANNRAIYDLRGVPQSVMPSDIYALVVTDEARDAAGNRLDGEFGGNFPSGDGTAGGIFAQSLGGRMVLPPQIINFGLAPGSDTGLVGTRPRSAPAGPVRGGGAAARTSAKSSAGSALVIWAAAVDPADVPMIRSASVTSIPAAQRPATTPISHALPVDPPPPRTNARPLGRSASVVDMTCGDEEGAGRHPVRQVHP